MDQNMPFFTYNRQAKNFIFRDRKTETIYAQVHTTITLGKYEKTRTKEKHTLVPCVLDTRVFPMLRTLNTDGALMSYQSFLEKGSTL